ncbi:MAG: hypothetical protein MMC33_008454 [Icmadophila ericetorum]|nr:hypothetical protein [Icmadophila ericetorum]
MVTTAGRHEISVLAGGEPVAGSPFALEVAPGQLHPGSCSLSGPGVRSVQLGREMKLEVRLADCFGNSIADAGCIEAHDVQVRETLKALAHAELLPPHALRETTRFLWCAALQVAIEGPAETPVRRGPMEEGAYSFAYSTKTPGAYIISATAAGRHMDGSPATVTASIAEAHAPLCEVTGAPLRLTTTAGEEADVAFVAKDAKGFQKSLGGDVFTAAWARAGDDEPATHGVTSRAVVTWTWLCAGRVVDLGTGEYTAKFTATSAGAYSVSIKHNGCNIAGSPFPAEVLHTGIAADCSYVVQEGLERAVSGQQVTRNSPSLSGCSICIKHSNIHSTAMFRVRAMDKYLNLVKLPASDLDAAGPKGFQAMLLGPNKTEQVHTSSVHGQSRLLGGRGASMITEHPR